MAAFDKTHMGWTMTTGPNTPRATLVPCRLVYVEFTFPRLKLKRTAVFSTFQRFQQEGKRQFVNVCKDYGVVRNRDDELSDVLKYTVLGYDCPGEVSQVYQ